MFPTHEMNGKQDVQKSSWKPSLDILYRVKHTTRARCIRTEWSCVEIQNQLQSLYFVHNEFEIRENCFKLREALLGRGGQGLGNFQMYRQVVRYLILKFFVPTLFCWKQFSIFTVIHVFRVPLNVKYLCFKRLFDCIPTSKGYQKLLTTYATRKYWVWPRFSQFSYFVESLKVELIQKSVGALSYLQTFVVLHFVLQVYKITISLIFKGWPCLYGFKMADKNRDLATFYPNAMDSDYRNSVSYAV